jgi:hypothetical protein
VPPRLSYRDAINPYELLPHLGWIHFTDVLTAISTPRNDLEEAEKPEKTEVDERKDVADSSENLPGSDEPLSAALLVILAIIVPEDFLDEEDGSCSTKK